MIATALFDKGTTADGTPADPVSLSVQLLGVVLIIAWSTFACGIAFALLRCGQLTRASRKTLARGLDSEFSSIGGKVDRYKAFISHQKAGCGAAARWFQLALGIVAGGKDLIYLDSDNLVNLDQLLETVRTRVDVLVVLATDSIWWRPWCAGEIVSAISAGVPIVLVMVNDVELDFESPPMFLLT